MVAQRYRWDFIGLSTDPKPTKATSEKVTNGSTFYESNTSKLYVFYGDQWYEKTATGGGGGTSDFDQLSNRPKYNGTAMTHETDIVSFTGTDGNTAGTAGLVPAPATTDDGKFLKADGTWDTAGGGGPTVVQSTGNSTTDVMSQDATTKLLYPDITGNPYKMVIGEGYINSKRGVTINGRLENAGLDGIAIGGTNNSPAVIGANGRSNYSVSIGRNSYSSRGDYNVVIGHSASASSGQDTGDNVAIGHSAYAGSGSYTSSVALGSYAQTTRTGEVNVGTGTNGTGYNSTNYRVIGGVHDGQLAQDAVTVSQINGVIDAINTALNVNISHIGASS